MIIKLSASGKQVQVIDDSGVVFVTSKGFLERLFAGGVSSGFIVLTRMPFKVSSTRFPSSPVFNPVSGVAEADKGQVPLVEGDAFDSKVLKQRRVVKAFSDEVTL